jgi:hypothetical protein
MLGGAGCEQYKRQRCVNSSEGDLAVDVHGSRSIRRFYPGVPQGIFNGIYKSFTTRPSPSALLRVSHLGDFVPDVECVVLRSRA